MVLNGDKKEGSSKKKKQTKLKTRVQKPYSIWNQNYQNH